MERPKDLAVGSLEEAEVSVGPDGRLYLHDLDIDLILVALAVNPEDGLMRRRLALCKGRSPAVREEAR